MAPCYRASSLPPDTNISPSYPIWGKDDNELTLGLLTMAGDPLGRPPWLCGPFQQQRYLGMVLSALRHGSVA